MKYWMAALLPLWLNQAWAELPSLQAIVRYETVSLGADGTEKTLRYSEKWLRQGSHVWRERLSVQQHGDHADDDGHHHLDFASAPRHVWLDGNGLMRVEFLNREQKRRIAVEKREWSDIGFAASWPQAAQLIDLSQLKGFAVRRESADITRYSKAGKTLRWSARWRMPLSVAIRSADGRQVEKISITPSVLPANMALPWRQSAGWQKQDYLDTLD
ncbi:hypothetical protein [Chromobacterium sp. IIBBL 290-4]|uniref:hypothetical protein n=1 Tax=Chromobacterium sp. IIBBL 290-4 TaxID=2953890 RepID=UPI0020B764B4|nr:hypothetical protein [Chromobacterium sp. IIBBL 290-4]UTH74557.1 hypothetical protein NKT35_00110 [Chromobacterium sp. IIBBL 290-4]